MAVFLFPRLAHAPEKNAGACARFVRPAPFARAEAQRSALRLQWQCDAESRPSAHWTLSASQPRLSSRD